MKNKVLIAGEQDLLAHICVKISKFTRDVFVFDNNIQYFYPMTKHSIKNMVFDIKSIKGN